MEYVENHCDDRGETMTKPNFSGEGLFNDVATFVQRMVMYIITYMHILLSSLCAHLLLSVNSPLSKERRRSVGSHLESSTVLAASRSMCLSSSSFLFSSPTFLFLLQSCMFFASWCKNLFIDYSTSLIGEILHPSFSTLSSKPSRHLSRCVEYHVPDLV